MTGLFCLSTLILLSILINSAFCSLYDFEVKDGEGNTVSLATFRDKKAVLVVNTAINCGYTYTTFRDLNNIHKHMSSRGLQIIGFPTTQFGLHEPHNNEEIQLFSKNYGLLFPVYGVIDVNGPTAHPLYKYLKNNNPISSAELAWNFDKFLVVDGIPVKRYSARTNIRLIEKDLEEYVDPAVNEL